MSSPLQPPLPNGLFAHDLEYLQKLVGRLRLEDEQYLTTKEVARLLRISVRTVWRWVKQRRLPGPVRFTSACPRWHVGQLLQALHRYFPVAKARGKRGGT